MTASSGTAPERVGTSRSRSQGPALVSARDHYSGGYEYGIVCSRSGDIAALKGPCDHALPKRSGKPHTTLTRFTALYLIMLETQKKAKIMGLEVSYGLGSRRSTKWIAGVALLLLPLVAMQFTDEVVWTFSDFLFAGILIFGSLGAYELVARTSTSPSYRAGVGLAIAGAFLLTWINAAVGITDSDADSLYLAVIAIGLVGAFVARFRPAGMALAMIAVVMALLAVGLFALTNGLLPEHNSPYKIAGITAIFVVLFVGAALLFRMAGHEPSGTP
jgi:hypothetical protein